MEILERLKETFSERPFKASAAVAALLGWLIVPVTVQKIYGISAIEVSFALIIIYYVLLKAYKWRNR